MTRRSIFRVLLSLLLLVSQQMAFAHVVTHWNAQVSASAEVQKDDGLSKAFAKDQSCGQCLAFAQFASAIGNSPRAFVPPDQASGAVFPGAERAVCARTVCVFDSRAPPAAV